jgi:hypothetical protein
LNLGWLNSGWSNSGWLLDSGLGLNFLFGSSGLLEIVDSLNFDYYLLKQLGLFEIR